MTGEPSVPLGAVLVVYQVSARLEFGDQIRKARRLLSRQP